MMKVADPIIFGHAVKAYFKALFEKHGATFETLGVDVNNGFGDLLSKIASLRNLAPICKGLGRLGELRELKLDLSQCPLLVDASGLAEVGERARAPVLVRVADGGLEVGAAEAVAREALEEERLVADVPPQEGDAELLARPLAHGRAAARDVPPPARHQDAATLTKTEHPRDEKGHHRRRPGDGGPRRA